MADSRERLVAELPLAEPPQVIVWPERLERIPVLPLRIRVEVVPQRPSIKVVGQDLSGEGALATTG